MTLAPFVGALLLAAGCAQRSDSTPPNPGATLPATVASIAGRGPNPQVRAGASNPTAVTQVYQLASPAVVTVTSTIQSNAGPLGMAQQQGTGSGFIIDGDGRIITNNHVVEDANRLEVTLPGGKTVPAQLVGRDPFFDLAVISVDPSGSQLTTATLGDSDQLQIGELAVAIGNPFGLEGTVTTGVISARRATVPEPEGGGVLIDAIQTDASINPGNSGGPLLNADGEVIGINTLARLGVSGGTAGINFAIPINAAKRIVPALIQSGTYNHPFLGVGTVPITQSIAQELGLSVSSGLIVQTVEPGSGAAQAGIRAAGPPQQIRSRQVGAGGDIITGVDGQPLNQGADLLTYLERNKSPGDTVNLQILRDGQEQTVPVKLGNRPPPTPSGR
ncbi:MAG TPA: trypsin-like peptidase domain-containing protein [Chloroflexota bacterium]|nr:trypsin-like peptidase domain-containing protein [Chloroflexota bacterium]